MWKDSNRNIVVIFQPNILRSVGFHVRHSASIFKLRIELIQKLKSSKLKHEHTSRVSNIESDNSQNVGLEDYNNISDGIFPHFTTPSIKISLG